MIKSFTYAWKGLKHTYTHERNFRTHVVVATAVIIAMLVLGVSRLEAVALIFVMTAVLVLEVINSVVERFIDLLKPRLNQYSEIIKDMMAAAVALTAVGAAIVGLIIFWPYIATLLSRIVV